MDTRTESQDRSLKQALVAGGQSSFVMDKLKKSLARHGIAIHTHWSWDKKRPPQKFPENIDLIYICTDMIGHNLANPCVDHARDVGIPFVNGTRKWAESIERLASAGFPLIDPVSVMPDLIQESRANRSPKDLENWPNEDDLRGFASALGLPAEQLPPGLRTPNTISTSVTTAAAVTLPAAQEPAMSTASQVHLAVTNPKQREYVRALAFKPDIDNVELWNTLAALPAFVGNKFDPERASTARKSLGINIVRKGGARTVYVNPTVFAATLKVAKIDGAPAPQATYVEPDPAVKNLPNAPAPALSPAPAPVSAPVPVVHAAAPAPAIKTPLSGMDELKDLLTLVRVKMAEEAITELHITPEGVKFKQVKVVEGSLEV